MNACLRELARTVIQSFRDALDRLGIEAPFYISQNDGTLMSSEFAEAYPVLTFASGPTNSMRGAAFLSGARDAVVVDIGGTTSDVGALQHGFPREASAEVEIAAVKTNFRMPDIVSIGLGGGSIVRENGGVEVGPLSVGYELTERSLVFGGDTLTATDVAVAAGMVELGDPAAVRGLPGRLVEDAVAEIHRRVELAIDRVKTSADPVPVVLVGGGTILVSRPLAGASEIVRPAHAAVANAIGAAIAQAGGEIDRVFALDRYTREEAMAEAKREATAKAVAAGAAPLPTRSGSSTWTRSRSRTCRATPSASASRRSATSCSTGRFAARAGRARRCPRSGERQHQRLACRPGADRPPPGRTSSGGPARTFGG
jgi:N-methylhydantoinase A/oxoprolinase/acetone carboxylase beta subunit